MPATHPPPRRRGAQPGNMNALKHGRRSRRATGAVQRLIDDPDFALLLELLGVRTRGCRSKGERRQPGPVLTISNGWLSTERSSKQIENSFSPDSK